MTSDRTSLLVVSTIYSGQTSQFLTFIFPYSHQTNNIQLHPKPTTTTNSQPPSMSEQKHIGSGFVYTNTAEEVAQGIDLHGKNIIVTGGYSGIGLDTVRVFLKQGAQVFVPARDVERAKKALADFGVTAAIVEYLDLTKPDTITAYAKAFLARDIPLHILVDNAGIMATLNLQLNEKGFEGQFATNHLGHFQLALLLKPALIKAHGARIISVSSMGHQFSGVDFDDTHFKTRPYDPVLAYGQSKTANILFALELDKRWKQHQIRAFSVHPGVIMETNLANHLNVEFWGKYNLLDAEGKLVHIPDMKNIPQGASTSVFAAVSPKLDGLGGLFLENNEVTFPVGHPEVKAPFHGIAPHAVDPEAASKLWALSEEWTGVKDL